MVQSGVLFLEYDQVMRVFVNLQANDYGALLAKRFGFGDVKDL